MSSSGTKVIVTQLVVDASGAKQSVDEFNAALAKARAATTDTGASVGSFDSALKKWTQSLASTDPVLRAQVQLQKQLQQQMDINTRAVQLGITTHAAAEAQLEKVRQKYTGYVAAANEAQVANTLFGKGLGFIINQAAPLTGVLSAAAIVGFAKSTFENASQLKNLAEQAGVGVEALQAYQAAMRDNGISAQDANQLIAKLTHSIGDARASAGGARDAFNLLGLGYQDLSGGVEKAMPKIAAALLAIPDATTRSRIEVDLFSRSGQKLESALRDLADPTADLITKYKALGLVLDKDVSDAAEKAGNALDNAFSRLTVSAAPSVVALTGALADFIDMANKVEKLRTTFTYGDLGRGLTGQGFHATGKLADATNSIDAPNPANDNGTVYSGIGGTAASGYSTANESQFLATAKQAADLAGLSLVRRAQETATIGLANSKLQDGTAILKDQNGNLVKQVSDYAQARQLVGDTNAKHVESLAAISAQGDQWRKVREVFSGYLAGLSEEARVAGVSAAQRETELAIIKGAQVYQKQRGVEEKNLVQTYDQALQKLSATQVLEIQRREAAKFTAGFEKEIADQVALANVASAAGRDDRDLRLQIAQKQLDLGRSLTEEERQQLALIQRQNDSGRLNDFIAQMKDEASLASLSADERERQQATLEAMRITHGHLTDDQAREINGLVQIRQETEQWRGVVDGLATPCEEFPEEFLADPDNQAEIQTSLQEIFQ